MSPRFGWAFTALCVALGIILFQLWYFPKLDSRTHLRAVTKADSTLRADQLAWYAERSLYEQQRRDELLRIMDVLATCCCCDDDPSPPPPGPHIVNIVQADTGCACREQLHDLLQAAHGTTAAVDLLPASLLPHLAYADSIYALLKGKGTHRPDSACATLMDAIEEQRKRLFLQGVRRDGWRPNEGRREVTHALDSLTNLLKQRQCP
ncbi:MAG TPA: hypothetical protein VHL57_05040 [Flavobacteriales bacterium]|jgi:hypothetical protein|nr:hypothetical protein [Flavobacteriales bacterium]